MGKSKLDTFFVICIPAYNVEKYIDRCLMSVLDQVYENFQIVIVDDYSTDNTKLKIAEWAGRDNRVHLIKERPTKMFNGGGRNHCVEYADKHFNYEYLMFLDADDRFYTKYALSLIHNKVLESKYPDMIRLSYDKKFEGGGEKFMKLNETTLEELTWTKRVAAWTKALKRDKFVPFPENTLFEDVVQHIAQCDVIENFVCIGDAIVEWNIRPTSTSRSNSPKWQSSAWRYVADLQDLELVHDYTKFRRDKKLKWAKEGCQKGEYIQ